MHLLIQRCRNWPSLMFIDHPILIRRSTRVNSGWNDCRSFLSLIFVLWYNLLLALLLYRHGIFTIYFRVHNLVSIIKIFWAACFPCVMNILWFPSFTLEKLDLESLKMLLFPNMKSILHQSQWCFLGYPWGLQWQKPKEDQENHLEFDVFLGNHLRLLFFLTFLTL